MLRIRYEEGRSQPNYSQGGEKISGGAKYLSSILKFEVKNRRKSAEEAKAFHLLFATPVFFFKVIK